MGEFIKKFFFIAIVFFQNITATFAQKNTFSIAAGPSIPLGQYSNTNIQRISSGGAKPGSQINLSFDHKVNSSFSFSVMAFAQSHGINAREAAKFLSERSYRYRYNLTDSVYYKNWKFDKNRWLNAGLLLGGKNEFFLNKQLSLTTKALIGIVFTTSPTLSAKSLSDSTEGTFSRSGKSGHAVAYVFDAGVKYKLNQKLFVLLGLQYLGTNHVKFEQVIQRTSSKITYDAGYSSQVSFQRITADFWQSIQTLDVNIGIGFKL